MSHVRHCVNDTFYYVLGWPKKNFTNEIIESFEMSDSVRGKHYRVYNHEEMKRDFEQIVTGDDYVGCVDFDAGLLKADKVTCLKSKAINF